MSPGRGDWGEDPQLNARLAFEKKVKSLLTADAPLYAPPRFDIDDVMVLAYRLKRQIERKPLACARRNDNFLVPTDKLAAGQARVLALMDGSQIGLVRVVNDSPAVHREACQDQTVQASDKGDD